MVDAVVSQIYVPKGDISKLQYFRFRSTYVHNVFSVSKTSIKFKNMKFMIETRLKLTLYLKSVDYNLTLFPKNYPRELFYKRHNKLRPPVVICT